MRLTTFLATILTLAVAACGDTGTTTYDAGDTSPDTSLDAGFDGADSFDADAGTDTSPDTSPDLGFDAGFDSEVSPDVESDATPDVGRDTGLSDATFDTNPDSEEDAGWVAPPESCFDNCSPLDDGLVVCNFENGDLLEFDNCNVDVSYREFNGEQIPFVNWEEEELCSTFFEGGSLYEVNSTDDLDYLYDLELVGPAMSYMRVEFTGLRSDFGDRFYNRAQVKPQVHAVFGSSFIYNSGMVGFDTNNIIYGAICRI